MLFHQQTDDVTLRQLIRNGEVTKSGNSKLGIFGTLSCASGKRMKRSNRVFFKDEDEALRCGYRPCGHCLQTEYRVWKTLK